MRRQRKMTAHSCCLPLSAVSHLNEQCLSFFSCGHPHKYFNCISLSLQCKLEQQACLTGKELSITCTGFCPCATASVTATNTDAKRGKFSPPSYTCILIWGFTPPYMSHEVSRKESYDALVATKHAVSRRGLQFSHRTNQPTARRLGSILTNFRDYC